MFDKIWFKKHQKILLKLLNTPLIKVWFRWCMRIRYCDCSLKEKITEIAPNNFSYGNKLILAPYLVFKDGHSELFDISKPTHRKLKNTLKIESKLALKKTTDFRTHNKYSKRLFYAFYPIWVLCHCWDILIANNFKLSWNLGFDFTFYPATGTGGESVDGWLRYSGAQAVWDTVHDQSVGHVDDGNNTAMDRAVGIVCGTTQDQYTYLYRSIFTINTEDLADDAVINTATFSLYGHADSSTTAEWEITANIYSSNPITDNALENADFLYTRFGTDAYCDTGIAESSWNDAGYNAFVFNATGKAAVNKTGITKLSLRDATYDVADGPVIPWATNVLSLLYLYFVDQPGTTYDPKLVILVVVAISVSDTVNTSEEALGIVQGSIISVNDIVNASDSLVVSLSALLSIAKLSGYATDSNYKHLAFKVSGAGYKSQIDMITIETEQLSTGARADFTLYYDKAKSSLSLGNISYSTANKTKHILTRKGPQVEDFLLSIDFSQGSASNPFKIRSIEITGHHIKSS